ncbi:hypothetical protein EUGRSUZ_A02340 [Eucalyptus grandis]|uniref:Uncharacterized protein n=2 Tax=Eucalyptus grandis TaxID=71139 RepID=A0ACC3M7D0_EUCGR|nr:hypothetical protein EUGRSUZ_A02340 [Eucalyptus grandis]
MPTLPSSGSSKLVSIDSSHYEVLAILDAAAGPVEPALDRISPFLSHDVVESVVREQRDRARCFRFLFWAMRDRRFRVWDSHRLVVDVLAEEEGAFDVYWRVLEEVRSCGLRIVSDAFLVLISAYWKMGMAEKAVDAFERMRDFDCEPNVYTYNKIMHVIVRKQIFMLALAIYNKMAKSDCLPNQATYTILIDAFCKTGKIKDALKMFDEMTLRGISPNERTYTIVIAGLCQAKSTDYAYKLFESMRESGCSPDTVTYNVLLDGFCKAGKIDEALLVLPTFEKEAGRYDEVDVWYRRIVKEEVTPDVTLYAIMIRGLSKAGRMEDAMSMLEEMTQRGLTPNSYCYNAIVKGFCDAGLLDEARSLQLEISRRDSIHDACTYTILISGLCRNGLVEEARQIFDEMEKHGCLPSVVTFNALINGLCKSGQLQEANLLLHKMEIGRNPSIFLLLSQGSKRGSDSERLKEMGLADSVTYATVIDGLQRVDREEKAFKLFDQMERVGIPPSSSVYKCLITWSCRRQKLPLAFSLWLKYLNNLPGRDDGTLKVAEDHFEKGEVEQAFRHLLQLEMSLKDFDLAPYNILLIGMCQAWRIEEALKIFLLLKENELEITYTSCSTLLPALCKEGYLDASVEVFLYMLEGGFHVKFRHCNQLIRSLLLSDDRRQWAYGLIDKMESLGLKFHLYESTESLLHRHSNMRNLEQVVPG